MRLPRTFWLLFAGALINRLGTFVVPFLPLYLTGQRGLSVERAGAVVSLYGLGTLVVGPLAGVVADRVGRRVTLGLGLILGGFAMLQLGFAEHPLHVALAAFLLGLCGDSYRPALSAAVADLVPEEGRPRAYALLFWAANLGFTFATVLGGLVASRSFFALFIADAATTFAFAALVFALIPETRDIAHPPATRSMLIAPLRDGVFVAFVALVFATAATLLQSISTLPLVLRDRGVSPAGFGVIIALNAALIVLVQPFAPALIAGREKSRVLAVSALLIGAGFALNLWAASMPAYALSVAVWTGGEILFSTEGETAAADLAPASLRGTYQGYYRMAWGAAFFAGPLLGTSLLTRLGPRALWWACGALGVAMALLYLATGPARKRGAALAAATGPGLTPPPAATPP